MRKFFLLSLTISLLLLTAAILPYAAKACTISEPAKGHSIGLANCPQDVTDFVLAADMCRPNHAAADPMEQRLSDSDPKSLPCNVNIEFAKQRDELLAKYKDDATVLPTLEAAINNIFNKK